MKLQESCEDPVLTAAQTGPGSPLLWSILLGGFPEDGERGLSVSCLPPPDPSVHVFQELPAWAEEKARGSPPLLL